MMQRSAVGYVLGATLAILVAASIPGFAQKPSDLSGKWMFDKAKSDGTPTVLEFSTARGLRREARNWTLRRRLPR